ncbi:hypothetical protein ACFPYJ_01440 [Paenibacillus solisilvae]|uniref:MmyB-like transcription regulator ligand binding domain-containing protein n=1 Tax=Paenibacillus solisilvae TaxID=2486751 RepID=A0ABW0VPW7_9BACL
MTPSLRKILDNIAYPAILVGNRTDVIAWNAPVTALFGDFGSLAAAERNMTWQVFANPSLRERVADWETYAAYAIAIFRGYFDSYIGDPWFTSFVEELKQVSPFFREHWDLHDIRNKAEMIIEFIGPGRTRQRYDISSFFDVNGNKDIHFCVYTPID